MEIRSEKKKKNEKNAHDSPDNGDTASTCSEINSTIEMKRSPFPFPPLPEPRDGIKMKLTSIRNINRIVLRNDIPIQWARPSDVCNVNVCSVSVHFNIK